MNFARVANERLYPGLALTSAASVCPLDGMF